jgi:tape measure domain-containing protein
MDVTKRIRVEVVTSGVNGLKTIEARLNAAQAAWEILGNDLSEEVTPRINPKPLGDLREEIDATAESWFSFRQSLESGLAIPSYSGSMPSMGSGGSGRSAQASPNIVVEFPDLLDVRLDVVSIRAMQEAVYKGSVKSRPGTINKLITGGLEAAGASLYRSSGVERMVTTTVSEMSKNFSLTAKDIGDMRTSIGVFISTMKRTQDVQKAGRAFLVSNEKQGISRENNATVGVIEDFVKYGSNLQKLAIPAQKLQALHKISQIPSIRKKERANAIKESFPEEFREAKQKLERENKTKGKTKPVSDVAVAASMTTLEADVKKEMGVLGAAVVNPIRNAIRPLMKQISDIQTLTAIAEAYERINDGLADGVSNLEKIVLVVGGAGNNGRGGQKLSGRVESAFPEHTAIPINNPQSDPKGGQFKVQTPIMQAVVNALGAESEFAKIENQLMFALDPTAVSDALVDALTIIEGTKGKIADKDILSVAYSQGGVENTRLAAAMTILNRSVQQLSMASPVAGVLPDEVLKTLHSITLAQDDFSLLYDTGIYPKTDQRTTVNDAGLGQSGSEAHALQHLFKSPAFLDLVSALGGAKLDPETAPTVIKQSGSFRSGVEGLANFKSYLGTGKLSDAVATTKNEDEGTTLAKSIAAISVAYRDVSKIPEKDRTSNIKEFMRQAAVLFPDLVSAVEGLEVELKNTSGEVSKISLSDNPASVGTFLTEIATLNETLSVLRGDKEATPNTRFADTKNLQKTLDQFKFYKKDFVDNANYSQFNEEGKTVITPEMESFTQSLNQLEIAFSLLATNGVDAFRNALKEIPTYEPLRAKSEYLTTDRSDGLPIDRAVDKTEMNAAIKELARATKELAKAEEIKAKTKEEVKKISRSRSQGEDTFTYADQEKAAQISQKAAEKAATLKKSLNEKQQMSKAATEVVKKETDVSIAKRIDPVAHESTIPQLLGKTYDLGSLNKPLDPLPVEPRASSAIITALQEGATAIQHASEGLLTAVTTRIDETVRTAVMSRLDPKLEEGKSPNRSLIEVGLEDVSNTIKVIFGTLSNVNKGLTAAEQRVFKLFPAGNLIGNVSKVGLQATVMPQLAMSGIAAANPEVGAVLAAIASSIEGVLTPMVDAIVVKGSLVIESSLFTKLPAALQSGLAGEISHLVVNGVAMGVKAGVTPLAHIMTAIAGRDITVDAPIIAGAVAASNLLPSAKPEPKAVLKGVGGQIYALGELINQAGELQKTNPEAGKQLGDLAVSALVQKLKGIEKFASNNPDQMKGSAKHSLTANRGMAVGRLENASKHGFENIGKESAAGLITAYPDMEEAAKGLGNKTYAAYLTAKEVLGVASPSKKFRYLAEMMAAGILSGKGAVIDAAKSIGRDVLNVLDNLDPNNKVVEKLHQQVLNNPPRTKNQNIFEAANDYNSPDPWLTPENGGVEDAQAYLNSVNQTLQNSTVDIPDPWQNSTDAGGASGGNQPPNNGNAGRFAGGNMNNPPPGFNNVINTQSRSSNGQPKTKKGFFRSLFGETKELNEDYLQPATKSVGSDKSKAFARKTGKDIGELTAKSYQSTLSNLLPESLKLGFEVLSLGTEGIAGFAEGIGLADAGLRLLPAVAGVAAAGMSIKFAGVTYELDNMNNKLKSVGMTGSDSFGKLFNFAQKAGLKLSDATETMTQIVGATQGTDVKGDVIADKVGGLKVNRQLDDETFQRARAAITQMISKGQVQMEELKGQLSEAVPNAIPAMARAMGVETRQVAPLVATGNVQTTAIIDDFLNELNSGSDVGSTFEMQMNKATNSITVFQGAVGKPAFDTFHATLQVVNPLLEGMANNASTLSPILQSVGVVGLAAMGSLILKTGILQTAFAGLKGALFTALASPWTYILAAVTLGVDQMVKSIYTGLKESTDNLVAQAQKAQSTLAKLRRERGEKTEGVDNKEAVTRKEASVYGSKVGDYLGSDKSSSVDNSISELLSFGKIRGGRFTDASDEQYRRDMQGRKKQTDKGRTGDGNIFNLLGSFGANNQLKDTKRIAETGRKADTYQLLASKDTDLEIQRSSARLAGFQLNPKLNQTSPEIIAEKNKLEDLKKVKRIQFSAGTGGQFETLGDLESAIEKSEKLIDTLTDSKQIAAQEQLLVVLKQQRDVYKSKVTLNEALFNSARNQAQFETVGLQIDSNSQNQLAGIANLRAAFAITNEQSAMREAEVEVAASQLKIGALNEVLNKQKQVIQNDPNKSGIEAFLGKSVDNATLADIAGAKVKIDADPAASGLKNIADLLEDVKRKEFEVAGATNAAAQARKQAAEANRQYLASLRNVLNQLEQVTSFEDAFTSMLAGKRAESINTVKRQQLNSKMPAAYSEIKQNKETIAASQRDIALSKALIGGLNGVVNSLDANTKAQADNYVGTDIRSASLVDVNTGLQRIGDDEAKGNPVNNDVKSALLAKQKALIKTNEIPGLETQMLDAQLNNRFQIDALQIRDIRQNIENQLRSMNREIEDSLLETANTILQTQQEIASMNLQNQIEKRRGDILKSLRGINSPALDLFNTIAEAVTAITGVMNEQADKQRELKQKFMATRRKGEDLKVQQRDSNQQIIDPINATAGVAIPIVVDGNKGDVSPKDILKAAGLTGSFKSAGDLKLPEPTLFDGSPALSPTTKFSQSIGTANIGLDGLNAGFDKAGKSLLDIDAATIQSYKAFTALNNAKIDGIVSKAANDLNGVVNNIIDALNDLPISVARFKLDLEEFRQGSMPRTIDQDTQRAKQEARISLTEKYRAYDNNIKLIKGLSQTTGNDPKVVDNVNNMLADLAKVNPNVTPLQQEFESARGRIATEGMTSDQMTRIIAALEGMRPSENDLALNARGIDYEAAKNKMSLNNDIEGQTGKSAFTNALAGSKFVEGTMFGDALKARAEIESMLQTQAARLQTIQETAFRAGKDVNEVTQNFMALENIKLNSLTEQMKTMKTQTLDIAKEGVMGLGDAIYSAIDGTKDLGESISEVFRNLGKRLFDMGFKNIVDNMFFKIGQQMGVTPKLGAVENVPVTGAMDMFTGLAQPKTGSESNLGVSSIQSLTPVQGGMPVYVVNPTELPDPETGLVKGGQGGDPNDRPIPLAVPKVPPTGLGDNGKDLFKGLPPSPGVGAELKKVTDVLTLPQPVLTPPVKSEYLPVENVGSKIDSLSSAMDYLKGASNAALGGLNNGQIGRGMMPQNVSPENMQGFQTLYEMGGATPPLDPAKNLMRKLETETLRKQIEGILKTKSEGLGITAPMTIGEMGVNPSLENLKSILEKLGGGGSGLGSSPLSLGAGMLPSGVPNAATSIINSGFFDNNPTPAMGALGSVTSAIGSLFGADTTAGNPMPVVVTNADELKPDQMSQLYKGFGQEQQGSGLAALLGAGGSLAGAKFGTTPNMLGGDSMGAMSALAGAFSGGGAGGSGIMSLLGGGGAGGGLMSLFGGGGAAAGASGAATGAMGAATGASAAFPPLMAAMMGLQLVFSIFSAIRAAKKRRQQEKRDEATAKEQFGRNNDNFYLKRESGAYSTKNLSDYEKRYSTGDMDVAGRYAGGGLISDTHTTSVNPAHADLQENLAGLLQAEGKDGRVIVASVGETILTKKQTDLLDTAQRSGALDLIGSGSGQGRFADGGIVGSSRMANLKASSGSRGPDASSGTTNLHAPTTINIQGVKDYDSFKRSESELSAKTSANQTSQSRRLLGG